MTPHRSMTLLAGAAVVPLAAIAVAAGASAAPAAPAAPAHRSTARATVDVRASALGKILVDSSGRTLYLFKKDTGTRSACSGACAAAWPPLRVTGKPTAGAGAQASKLGTTRRSDGRPQVTYHGHPLYRFSGDRKAGDTNGEGLTAFGAKWFVVSPAGSQVSGTTSGSGATPGY